MQARGGFRARDTFGHASARHARSKAREKKRGKVTAATDSETQGDAAPASLLKNPVTKKDANADSDDDDFYDRTASRAKVPLSPSLPCPRLALRLDATTPDPKP